MNYRLVKTTALALAIPMALTGCVTNNMNDQQRTKAQGAGIGAGAGALLGAVGGALLDKKHPGQGALLGGAIGALAGGAAGYAWGSSVAAKKQQYANHERYLNDCIAELRQQRATVVANNSRLRQSIAAQKIELQQLVAMQQSYQAPQERVAALDSHIQSEIQAAQSDLQRTDGLIKEHTDALNAEKGNGASQANWSRELAGLQADRQQTVASLDTLNQMQQATQTLAAR